MSKKDDQLQSARTNASQAEARATVSATEAAAWRERLVATENALLAEKAAAQAATLRAQTAEQQLVQRAEAPPAPAPVVPPAAATPTPPEYPQLQEYEQLQEWNPYMAAQYFDWHKDAICNQRAARRGGK